MDYTDTAPLDPETLFLSRAAAHVIDAERTKGTDGLRFRATLALWEDLTGLVDADAIAYARRVVETQGEVTAHVAPF